MCMKTAFAVPDNSEVESTDSPPTLLVVLWELLIEIHMHLEDQLPRISWTVI